LRVRAGNSRPAHATIGARRSLDGHTSPTKPDSINNGGPVDAVGSLRLFSAAARLASSGQRLRLAERWPWSTQITTAATRLQAIPSG
jgi:hypothetical protein